MKLSRTITSIVLFSIISLSAAAQNNNSLRDENRRINQGIVSGELTAAEAGRLKLREADLRRDATRYKANDGRIGPVERRHLKRENRRLSRNIYRQKHDCQKRF